MGAAKRTNYSFFTSVSGFQKSTTRIGESRGKSLAQPEADLQAGMKATPRKTDLDLKLSIAGEALPEALVKTLKSYTVTPFKTKSKDELLAMLVDVR